MILVEHGPTGAPALFQGAAEVVVAADAAALPGALARLDAARAQGAWVAGWIAYEAGYGFEPRLLPRMPAGAGPLLAMGIFDGPRDAGAIRTLSLRGEDIVMNVGGGVVADSTADGEWEEALWKARFVKAAVTPHSG